MNMKNAILATSLINYGHYKSRLAENGQFIYAFNKATYGNLE